MPPKLGGNKHSQSKTHCYIISYPDIRRLIQVFGAKRSVIVEGAGAVLRFLHNNGQIL
jgi:hypothetical protein